MGTKSKMCKVIKTGTPTFLIATPIAYGEKLSAEEQKGFVQELERYCFSQSIADLIWPMYY